MYFTDRQTESMLYFDNLATRSYGLSVIVGGGAMSSDVGARCVRGGTKGLVGERLDEGDEEELPVQRKSAIVSIK